MKTALVTSILFGFILLALLILNLSEISDVLFGKGDYPFGSEFFASNSIYKSKATFLLYHIVASTLLVLTFLFLLRKRKKWFTVLVVLDILLFVYPMATNE